MDELEEIIEDNDNRFDLMLSAIDDDIDDTIEGEADTGLLMEHIDYLDGCNAVYDTVYEAENIA